MSNQSAYADKYKSKNSTQAHLQYFQGYQIFFQGATFLEYIICPPKKESLWERLYFNMHFIKCQISFEVNLNKSFLRNNVTIFSPPNGNQNSLSNKNELKSYVNSFHMHDTNILCSTIYVSDTSEIDYIKVYFVDMFMRCTDYFCHQFLIIFSHLANTLCTYFYIYVLKLSSTINYNETSFLIREL